jgi:hypothetical protein
MGRGWGGGGAGGRQEFQQPATPLPHTPEALFIVPDWGDKIDYGIGL